MVTTGIFFLIAYKLITRLLQRYEQSGDWLESIELTPLRRERAGAFVGLLAEAGLAEARRFGSDYKWDFDSGFLLPGSATPVTAGSLSRYTLPRLLSRKVGGSRVHPFRRRRSSALRDRYT